MEHFVVSARKYRPQNFEDVVGQQSITKTLENAIANNHLAQALLFTGPRGVGKTSCARILAKKINEQDSENNGNQDFAFNIFELDAASNNSVDDIRKLTEQVRIPPQTGNYKVYIIDEVHMLSASAFNAFLKTLEEPPAHAIFILATTEKHKIIPTILSRCQIFDFKRIGVLDAKNYLKKIAEKEGITADDDALHIIAQKADGAMRDALSIFDRVVSFSGKNISREDVTQNLNVLDYDTYFTMTDLLLTNKIPEVLNAFNTILGKGFEGHHFINGLASHFRDLLVAKDKITIDLLEVGDTAKKKYLAQSTKASLPFLMQSIEKANNCDLNYRTSKNQRLLVELTLLQIASITFDGEKKKPANYIIPATFFTAVSPVASATLSHQKTNTISQQKVVSVLKETKNIKNVASATLSHQKEATLSHQKEASLSQQKEVTPKPASKKERPVLKNSRKRSSSLSLKSVGKTVVEKKPIVEENYDNHPKDTFTKEEFTTLWKEYQQILSKKGEKSMASILIAGEPILKENFVIQVALPNSLMGDQLQKGKNKLLQFLREKLNNYQVSLDIKVNETIEKKFAYTPLEKFNKLKEKNPLIEKLRTTFQLDM